MKSIGQRIKTVCVLSWMTQADFSRRVGVSRRQVVYWESGSDSPSSDRLPLISSVLNVPIDWLLTGNGWIHSVINRQNIILGKRRQLAKVTAHKEIRLPLFHELPNGPIRTSNSSPVAFLPGLPLEANSFVYKISDTRLSPTFSAGDLLYLRILNLVYPLDNTAGADIGGLLATLNGRMLALLLNGIPQLGRAEFLRKSNRVAASFTSAGGKHKRLIGATDSVLLQGVVYKHVREL